MNRVDWQPGVGLDIVETFQFWQEAQRHPHAGAFASFSALAHAFKLHGVGITSTPGDGTVSVVVSAGWALYNGEVIEVPAGNIVRLSSEVAWLEPLEQYVDATAPLNAEAVGQPVQVKRTLVLKKGSNLPAQGAFMALDAPTYLSLLELRLGSRLMRVGSVFIWDESLDHFDTTGLGIAGSPAEGLAICNGLNGTKDMRGLTAVGAVEVPSAGAGSLPSGVVTNYVVDAVFGLELVTLSQAQIPSHKHAVIGNTASDGAHTHRLRYNQAERGGGSTGTGILSGTSADLGNTRDDAVVDVNSAHQHAINLETSNVGGGESHENRQPSRAVVYVKVVS